MNLVAWILGLIHIYEFWCMISQYFSWPWIHICIHFMNSYMISWLTIHILYFMTYEFRHEFMYMKKIVKSCIKSWVPKFQMAETRACASVRGMSASEVALYMIVKQCHCTLSHIVEKCCHNLEQYWLIQCNIACCGNYDSYFNSAQPETRIIDWVGIAPIATLEMFVVYFSCNSWLYRAHGRGPEITGDHDCSRCYDSEGCQWRPIGWPALQYWCKYSQMPLVHKFVCNTLVSIVISYKLCQ